MLKHKRRRIRMCDVEYAHEQILATNATVGSPANAGSSAAAEQRREMPLHGQTTGMAA
jgi:hypothetical protein